MERGGGEIILVDGGVKWGCYGRMQSCDVLGVGMSGGGKSEAAGRAGVLFYRLEDYAEWHTTLKPFNL